MKKNTYLTKTLGKAIRQARLRKKMEQKELANQVGIYATRISQYELGTRTPSISSLILIAEALNVSIDALVYGHATRFAEEIGDPDIILMIRKFLRLSPEKRNFLFEIIMSLDATEMKTAEDIE